MDSSAQPRKLNWRKIGLAIWLVLFALLLLIHWYPIRFGALRLILVGVILALWLGALWLAWRHKIIKRVLVLFSLLFLVFILSPARATNPQLLRREYVRALESYENTTYVWGGESRRGIDCSGLMRCALIDANVKRGLATANPALLRSAFSLWWNDSSAKAMKEEHRGNTRFLFSAPTINQVNYSALEPGDIAVTSSGVHVLAYLGERTWIEADPNELQGNRVIKVKTPTRNAWFNQPVHVMRWRQLENSGD